MKEASRRDALKLLGAVTIGGVSGCDRKPVTQTEGKPVTHSSPPLMPVVYLPHGGGPWPYVRPGVLGAPDAYDKMSAYLRSLPSILPEEPRALLVVSAHWEEAVFTVQSSKRPPMLYDYSGFPPETYEVKWNAQGAPELAERVRALLSDAGIENAADEERGFDHGVFVPLGLSYPQAEVPTVQLSLKRGLDPEEHLRAGRALSALRSEGVFIVGSGMSYHNMGAFFGRVATITADSRAFQDWIVSTVTAAPAERARRLADWLSAPAARACHPREEHLLPLMVVAGAAEGATGQVPYEDLLMRAHILAAHFS